MQVAAGSVSGDVACPRSAWAVFGNPAFSRAWVATVLGLVGIAMTDAATSWLMAGMDADPRMVSLVQVAAFLPMFLFTLPAGALIDIVDPRRFLIALEAAITLIVVGFAAIVTLGLATPPILLGLTFLLSAAWSIAAPAWAALTPLLVSRADFEAAASANSVGYYLSRALGPALGGRMIAAIGVASPFWVFAVANALSVAILLTWRPPRRRERTLPAERILSALRAGLRHAVYNPHLRTTLIRTAVIFPFAAAFLALLPLVARSQMTSGPQVFGLLVAVASLGAAAGSIGRPYIRTRLGADRFVALGSIALVAALTMLGAFRHPAMIFLACFLAGAGWTTVLATLSVSAQIALPDWVRGRGLAVFLSVVFACITAGSFVWGVIASEFGLPVAYFLAAAGAVAFIPFGSRWRLQTAEGVDLSPSLHWQAPMLAREVEDDSGPVLVTLRYRLASSDPDPFLDAIELIGAQRRRDGAYAWGVFADVAAHGVYLETFLIGSWLEARYLRERVTNADRAREEELRKLLAESPSVTLMVAPDAAKDASASEATLDLYLTKSEMSA